MSVVMDSTEPETTELDQRLHDLVSSWERLGGAWREYMAARDEFHREKERYYDHLVQVELKTGKDTRLYRRVQDAKVYVVEADFFNKWVRIHDADHIHVDQTPAAEEEF